MKKKVVLGAALMMMPLVSFAGGYLTNTNQHAAFLGHFREVLQLI